jgi:diaminopimelate decarboxylase
MSRADGGAFEYRSGALYCEDVALSEVAAQHDTPTFAYSRRAIESSYDQLVAAVDFMPTLVAYAVKANTNHAILSLLGKRGCGADIVSGGELLRCLNAGIAPEHIVFSGVGKRDEEIEAALEHRIRAIHVESPEELQVVSALAERRGQIAPVTLRVNPNVDPLTHPYIATGLEESKFGVSLEVGRELVPVALADAHLQLEGVACHVGSQISSPQPLEEAIEILARFAHECFQMGAQLRSIDAGGGFPLTYGDEASPYPAWVDYGAAIERGIAKGLPQRDGIELIVEPGRVLVGGAGVLLTRVLYIKHQGDRRFIIVDAAMTELIRPALYQAYHDVQPVDEPSSEAPYHPADVVGPVCESGDFIALQRPLPEVQRGTLMVIHSAGAYGMSMASRYNSRPLPAEVMVMGDVHEVIQPRELPHELWRVST